MTELAAELVEMLEQDACALGCWPDLRRLPDMAARGTSADRQRAAYAGVRQAGGDHMAGLRQVVESLIDEYMDGF